MDPGCCAHETLQLAALYLLLSVLRSPAPLSPPWGAHPCPCPIAHPQTHPEAQGQGEMSQPRKPEALNRADGFYLSGGFHHTAVFTQVLTPPGCSPRVTCPCFGICLGLDAQRPGNIRAHVRKTAFH